jgi:uncharacterized protein YndB with AHSA1/START domain
MYIASGLTRSGSVPAILLFMRNPQHAEARIIYIEEEIEAPVEAVFAAFEAQIGAQADMVLAREADALLTVQWSMPDELPAISNQRTVLTLTFEPAAGGKTRLTLTHAGFGRGEAWDQGLAFYTRGWPEVIGRMKVAIEDRLTELQREAA